MSLRYIIDGCNLVHHPRCAPSLSKKYGDSRISLLEFIRARRLCGSIKNRVIVVFDGFSSADDFKTASSRLGIEVIFSGEQSADSVIKQLLEKAVQPSEVIVVSDDREVSFFARQSRARVLGVDAFVVSHQEARGTLQAGKEDAESKKCELNRDEQERINRELREKWLRS